MSILLLHYINDCATTQKWLYFSEFLGGAAQIFFRGGLTFRGGAKFLGGVGSWRMPWAEPEINLSTLKTNLPATLQLLDLAIAKKNGNSYN